MESTHIRRLNDLNVLPINVHDWSTTSLFSKDAGITRLFRKVSAFLLHTTLSRPAISYAKQSWLWYENEFRGLADSYTVLIQTLNGEHCALASRMISTSSTKTFNKTRSIQIAKYDKLTNKGRNVTESGIERRRQTTRTVINLSKKSLSKDEEKVLSLGLNFAVVPRSIPKEEIVQQLEPKLFLLPNETANAIRVQVAEVIRQAKLPESNLRKEEKDALSNLRSDKSIHILKADKGNATVVLDREIYDAKVSALLETTTYKELKRDPTPSIERKVSSKLLELLKNESLQKNLYRRLRPSASICPKFYGLPKIHKTDVPLRPIVASRGSPTYALAQYLAGILKPVVGKSCHHVQNSKELVSEIKTLKLETDDILVSFDVVSLFTNVPVEDACVIAKERLLLDETLVRRTSLSPEEVFQLLKLCLTSTCFQWRNRFFEQTTGAAMGSPLSPIMANLYMEEFEKKALASAALKPGMWKRYVDDTLSTWSHGLDSLSNFLDHLNSIHPSIKFTMELQNQDKSIPFLDILLTVKPDGSLSHTVYRKPTHTDRYLNYTSFHHPSIKSSVCKTLVHRARTICDEEHLQGELDHLKLVLANNGFPKKLIESSMVPSDPTPSRNEDLASSVCLPYIGPASHKIERILCRAGMKVFHSSQHKLYKVLYSHKDRVDDLSKPGVYRIPCECGLVYIGETGRNLSTRLKEHKTCCSKAQLEKSAVAKHAWEYDHQIKWEESSLLASDKQYFTRRMRESIEIAKNPTISQEGMPLNNTWCALFGQHS